MLLLMFFIVLLFFVNHFFQIIVEVYKFIFHPLSILPQSQLSFFFLCVISSPLKGCEEGDLSFIFKKVDERKKNEDKIMLVLEIV